MMNPNDSIDLKEVLSTASPLIKALVDTFVTPKLVSFRERFKPQKKSLLPTEEHFTEYYHRIYKKLIVINTLVFNNSQRLLPEIFLPLTLILSKDDKMRVKVDGFPETITNEYHNILITDTAGMGKSTLMKTIFIDLINNNLGIPLFIELRRLNKDKTLIDEIKEQLNSLNKEFDSALMLNLLSEGGFVIILDGYDEIALSDRDIVTKDLQEFISKASENKYFITSRPEKALTSFGNFQEFKIAPLSKKEAYELLRKYDNQGQISSLLIKKLQEKEMVNIEEFLTNPLLVSLLFTAFEHKQAIPFKKYLFYRQVYDANFESHDLTKGDSYTHNKYSKLEIDDFHRVLRHIGFNCLKLQRIEFSKDELLKLISESKSFCAGLSFKESDFLQDIIKTVPLFAQDGNYYRWSHKSLQEYFSAQFIHLDSKERQNDILLRLYNHPNIEKFINVLDLYYDMDYKTFRNTIELQFVTEYYNYSRESYSSFKNDIDPSAIIKRRELMFWTDVYLYKSTRTNSEKSVNTDEIISMIEKYKDQYNLDEKKLTGITVSSPFTSNIFTVNYQNAKYSIMFLLFSKKSTLIKPLKHKTPKDRIVNVKFNIEQDYVLKPITDSKDDEFNSALNFSDINKILESTRLFPLTIDSNKVIAKYKEIKNSIAMESQNDFLLGGI